MFSAAAGGVVSRFSVRLGTPRYVPSTGSHTNNPGPAGSSSFTRTWLPVNQNQVGTTFSGSYWMRIEYGTDGVTYPYWFYIETGSLRTGTVSGLAAGTYNTRLVAGDAVSNVEGLPGNYYTLTI